MDGALTTTLVRRELASALKSSGYSPVGKWLVKGLEESFVAVDVSKAAFQRCWRFTWHLGLRRLSPWFKDTNDFCEQPEEVSQFELHWRDTDKAVWVAPFLTDVSGLAVSEVQLPSIFDGDRILPATDPKVVSNALYRNAFMNVEQCAATIVKVGAPWLESFTTLARLTEARRSGSLFYFHLVPKAQALIAA